MPAVLVHGNPETSAIWEPMIAELDRTDVICASPPGFGAPVPAGFGATREEYGEWLVGEIEQIGEPVDLVGHDWGGGHVMHVAINRPDLLRSWCVDVLGIFSPDYVWHDMARVWQTPEAGEEAVAEMRNAPVDDRVAMFTSVGIPETYARRVIAGHDEDMSRCILALYRSAAQPKLGEVAAHLPKAAARPGLAIIAEHDHYVGGHELPRRSADAAGAGTVFLPGVGHWWMLQNPALGARTLTDFWATVR